MVPKKTIVTMLICMAGITAMLPLPASCGTARSSQQAQQPLAQNAIAKQVGVIKAISGRTITLTPDSGGNVSVNMQDNTKIVRVAPGQTDLKSATPIQLADLQVGDRVFVRGIASADAKSLTAAGIIVMKGSDVAAKQQQDREDWDKRGIGGVVTSVDPVAGTVTLSVIAAGVKKSIVVQSGKKTVLRRYAAGSVKFDDAVPATLDQIRPGDQLRARGTRNADGTEFVAEEIVSGSFRNIAGTITSIDAAANTVTVQDLIAKAPVTVKISDQSQIRKLPLPIAQRIAMRLKGAAADASGSRPANVASKAGASGAATQADSQAAGGSHQPGGAAGGGPRSGGGQADFQQIVNRMPAAKLANLQKGDAVMIVATSGANSDQVTAITVLGGVEPILTAAPSNAGAMTLSPWSLGGEPAAAGGEANP
jgi:hypothetical protein